MIWTRRRLRDNVFQGRRTAACAFSSNKTVTLLRTGTAMQVAARVQTHLDLLAKTSSSRRSKRSGKGRRERRKRSIDMVLQEKECQLNEVCDRANDLDDMVKSLRRQAEARPSLSGAHSFFWWLPGRPTLSPCAMPSVHLFANSPSSSVRSCV